MGVGWNDTLIYCVVSYLHTKETCPKSIGFISSHTFQLECKTQGKMCTKMHYIVHSLIKHRNCSLGLPLGIAFSSPCCTNIIARSQVGAGMEQTMHVKRGKHLGWALLICINKVPSKYTRKFFKFFTQIENWWSPNALRKFSQCLMCYKTGTQECSKPSREIHLAIRW
jgi:hypothetical protein